MLFRSSLSSTIKEMVRSNVISVGHAKVLLALPEVQKQEVVAQKISKEKLSVRATEKLVTQILSSEHNDLNNSSKDQDRTRYYAVKALCEEMQKMFGTKVSIDYLEAKGKISIYYYSDDELNNVIEKLRKGCQKN